MKSEPSVCAVMLTADRPELARRAVECFNAQRYQNKRLLVYDTAIGWGVELDRSRGDLHVYSPCKGYPVGILRNFANGIAAADILTHWDDDDYSHPNRIGEQVAILQEAGAEAVGYREMLFWDQRPGHTGAWLYKNRNPAYCLGTSLCYWRETWERHPFEALPVAKGGTGEDTFWLRGVKSCGALMEELVPRMVARIHPANTQDYSVIHTSQSWRRVPEWDTYCREVME